MKLTVLGCGDAFGSEGRYNTSFLLEDGEDKILVDCGATTLVRLKQLKVDIGKINTIIITHFHGDHYGGLPFLMLSNHFEYQRKSGLTIIGPRGIKDKAMNLQEALYPCTSEIVGEMGVRHLEYEEKVTMRHDDLDIYTQHVTHSPPSNPHGVKLKWKDKVFAFSGDTEWNDTLVDLADGSDIFIVECNNFENDSPGHLSYKTILEKESQLNTKKILLTHMGSEVIAQNNLKFDRLEDGMIIDF